MKQYHKIENVFVRDQETHKLIPGAWKCPEFELLQDIQWDATEKVDGTNIRVMWHHENVAKYIPARTLKEMEYPPESKTVLEFRGKTDRAQIPPHLMEKLQELFTEDKMKAHFDDTEVCLYGEGYGAKIQKGGGDYIPDGVGFILIDIRIGKWWLQRKDVEEIASKFEIPIVPFVGTMTLNNAISLVRHRLFHSELKTTPPEGLVVRPHLELFSRNGARIIAKIKGKDFE